MTLRIFKVQIARWRRERQEDESGELEGYTERKYQEFTEFYIAERMPIIIEHLNYWSNVLEEPYEIIKTDEYPIKHAVGPLF